MKILMMVLFLFGGNIYCEDKSTTTAHIWTLDDCLNYAMTNNPDVKAAKENIDSVKYSNYVLKSQFIPKAFAGYNYTRNSKTSFGSMTLPKAGLPPSLYSNDVYTLNLGVTDTLYSWSLAPTFKLASINLDIAKANYNNKRNTLVLNVKKAFYAVLLANQVYKIDMAAEAVARDNYETTKALYNEGKASTYDISTAKVRWVDSESALISAENNLSVAVESLKTILSLPADEEIGVKGEFDISTRTFVLNDSIRDAHVYRPEVIQAKKALEASNQNLKVANSGFLPSLTGSFTYSWSSPDASLDFGNQYNNWVAQLAISIPLFDGMSSIGKRKSAKAEIKKSEMGVRSIEDNVVMQTKQSYYSIENSRKSLEAQKENVSTAEENLKIAQERYALGFLSHLELKDAELSLISAQTQYVQTSYDYDIAITSFEYAVGLPYRE
jgi:outer membrane protein TolC